VVSPKTTIAMNNSCDEEEQLATINRSSHHQWRPKALIHRFSSNRMPSTASLTVKISRKLLFVPFVPL
jgi:hypothetical protein